MYFQILQMAICFAFPPITDFPPSRGFFQQSGIAGRIYLLAGNQMPSPRRARHADSAAAYKPTTDSLSDVLPRANGVGVAGTICVFALTNDSQVIRQGTSPYCQAVNSRLIQQVNSDDKGNFSMLLSPGTYSVFTKKGDLFYATRRDEKNNIAPVEVLPGKITRVDCRVESDHKVVY